MSARHVTMARYRLHCVGASGNSFKVALLLNCAGLDWEPVGVDFAGGQTRDPAWRARLATLPGWKPPYEMMPVGQSLPVRRRATCLP